MDIMEFQGEEKPVSYLGDGVYAIFDGFGICLHANDHENPTDRVYIKPEVLEALINFHKECQEIYERR